MVKISVLLGALISIHSSKAFTAPARNHPFTKLSPATTSKLSLHINDDELKSSFDPLHMSKNVDPLNENKQDFKVALASALVLLASEPSVANAAGPDWGIFEGRSGSLLHPLMMASMFLFSVSTGILGFQIRRTRSLGEEISALKKFIPKYNGSDLKAAIAEAEGAEEVDTVLVSSLKKAVPIQAEIDELTKERKELVASGPRDKHFGQGVLLAFLGTAFAIEGPLNTYARAGKLFPGPHLYAGAGLVVLWSLAAACVPSMQKGNDTARSIHIGANAAGMGLFGWQVVSGWPILLKVIEKTQWP